MGRRIDTHHHPEGESAMPQLKTPEDIARALRCSTWWVKEQARRRRIPFTMVGGAYRFTTDHLHEIIRAFERRPNPAANSAAAIPQPRRASTIPAGPPAAQLRARRPRRTATAA